MSFPSFHSYADNKVVSLARELDNARQEKPVKIFEIRCDLRVFSSRIVASLISIRGCATLGDVLHRAAVIITVDIVSRATVSAK